jgi:tetratricopeptide (TPR) repeat protein
VVGWPPNLERWISAESVAHFAPGGTMSRLDGILYLPASLLLGFAAVGWTAAPAQAPTQNQAKVLLDPADSHASTDQPSANTPSTQTPGLAEQQKNAEMIGDTDAARQRYQAAIAAYMKAPQMTATLWNKLGIAYQMMFNTNEAMRCYQKSLKLDAHNADVLNNLGTVYASTKNYGQADKMYRQALKQAPKSALVLKNYGTNLMEQHKFSKASEAYQKALAIDPTIFDGSSGPVAQNVSSLQERGAVHYYMALGCLRSGHTDCALDNLRSAIDEGYITAKKVAADKDFASLWGNPDFKKLVTEQNRP